MQIALPDKEMFSIKFYAIEIFCYLVKFQVMRLKTPQLKCPYATGGRQQGSILCLSIPF